MCIGPSRQSNTFCHTLLLQIRACYSQLWGSLMAHLFFTEGFAPYFWRLANVIQKETLVDLSCNRKGCWILPGGVWSNLTGTGTGAGWRGCTGRGGGLPSYTSGPARLTDAKAALSFTVKAAVKTARGICVWLCPGPRLLLRHSWGPNSPFLLKMHWHFKATAVSSSKLESFPEVWTNDR